jgi:hypothetical protein
VAQLYFSLVPCYKPSHPQASAGAAAAAATDSVTNGEATGEASTTVANAAIKQGSLSTEEEGLLTAAIRNALPASYAPGFYYWAGSCEEQEALGALLHTAVGQQPGTVVLLRGELGAGERGLIAKPCAVAAQAYLTHKIPYHTLACGAPGQLCILYPVATTMHPVSLQAAPCWCALCSDARRQVNHCTRLCAGLLPEPCT